MARHFLIWVRADYAPGPRVLGPYKTAGQQIEAAEQLRDGPLEHEDQLLWLDITMGLPVVGEFDPQFYKEGHG